MKHKLLISFFVLNELSAVALAATNKEEKAIGQTIMGGVGLAVGLLILWMFVRVGMFKGLRFRHYVFILICVILAMAAGYSFARG